MTDQAPPLLGGFRLGEWLVQPNLNRISSGDSRVSLEPKMMRVLVCLAQHPGELVERQDLIDTVWATEFISENILTRAIAELRSALGDDAKEPTYIETIHRKGYRLVAAVDRGVGEVGKGGTADTAVRPRWTHALAIAIAAVIAVLVILPPEALFERKADEDIEIAVPRIVVLPFENLGSPEDEYFADGVTEELISRLAAVSGLEVISRTSAMHYKDRDVPLQQIGEELEVSYVLEGAVRWDRGGEGHGRVRITPQLIEVAGDSHLWSDSYDRMMEDIFAVQTDIAENVVAQLRATIHEAERHVVEARPTQNMEAYQAYLLGIRYLSTSAEQRESILANEMLGRAVELDPEFALAFAALSESHSWLYHLRFDFTTERLEQARVAAERAFELEPGLPQAHRALGRYYYSGFRDFERAREQYELARRSLPNDAGVIAQLYAIQRRQGRWKEAVESLEQWRSLAPQGYFVAVESVITYMFLRQYSRADAEARRAIGMAPDRPDAYFFGVENGVLWEGNTVRARQLVQSAPNMGSPELEYRRVLLDLYDREPEAALALLSENSVDTFALHRWFVPKELAECICLTQMGEAENGRAACLSAVEVIEREIAMRPHDYRLFSAFGQALAILGRRDEAVRAGETAIELMPIPKDAINGSQQAIEMAQIFTRVGDWEEALDMIEHVLAIPSQLSVELLRLDPVWDPLRDHPRFNALLEEYE